MSDTGRAERPASRHEHERGAPLTDDCDGWCRCKYEGWQRRDTATASPAPERAALVERMEQAATKCERGAAYHEAGESVWAGSLFYLETASLLREAAALLKGEQS